MPDPFPDPRTLLVTALRLHPGISTLVAGRVSTELPGSPSYPLIVASAVTDVPGQPWESRARVQADCWAETEEDASLVSRTLVAIHPELRGAYPAGRILLTDALSRLWLPDPVSTRPRYVVDLRVTVAPA